MLVTKGTSWEDAIQTLSDDERYQFQVLDRARTDVLQDILSAIRDRKDECLRKQWKLSIRGKPVVIRDVLENMSAWVTKFIQVGDTVVQYDPGHAALPWAAIRFVLRATVLDVETFGFVLEDIETFSNLIARCTVQEQLYLCSQFEIADKLREAIVALFASILKYMAELLRYLRENTAGRFLQATSNIKRKFEDFAREISSKQSSLTLLANIAEAQRAQIIESNTNDILQEQIESTRQSEERERMLIQTLQQLDAPIRRIDATINELRDALLEANRAKILQALSSVPYPKHHKTASKERMPDSGQWLLRKDAYRQWRAKSSNSVLWLHGIPGSGKTKLTSLVVDDVKDSEQIAFFYCARSLSEPQRGQCDKVLASLVRQLAGTKDNRAILKPVIELYQDAVEGFADFGDQELTITECVSILLRLFTYYPAVTIIVDALDEVDPLERPQLMDALEELARESSTLLKIFVSSRENYDIVLRLRHTQNVYIHTHDNAQDITDFITDRVSRARLLNGQISADLLQQVKQTLQDRSQGMFRMVDLQIQTLRSLKTALDIEARLTVLPATLEDSYMEIYTSMKESGEHAWALAETTFQWLLYAHDVLPIDQLALFMSYWPNREHIVHTAAEVQDICGVFITVDEASIRFSHLSVREFLEGRISRGHAALQSESANAAISSACITCVIDLSDIQEEEESDLKATTSQAKSLKPASKEDDNPNLPSGRASPRLSIMRALKEKYKVDAHSERFPGPQMLTNYVRSHWYSHLKRAGPFAREAPLIDQLRRLMIGDDKLAQAYKTWLAWGDPIRDLYRECPIYLICDYDLDGILDDLLDITPHALYAGSCGSAWEEPAIYRSPIWYSITTKKSGLLRRMLARRPRGLVAYLTDEALKTIVASVSPTSLTPGNLDPWASAAEKAEEIVQLDAEALTLLFRALATKRDLIKSTERNLIDLTRCLLECGIGGGYLSAALDSAYLHDNILIADMLLAHGAQKQPAAIVRAIKGQTYQTAISLINAGYEVNGRYLEKRRTALHYAVDHGRADIVRLLLQRGAKANVIDRDGHQPRHLAERAKRWDIVSILGENSANPSMPITNGDCCAGMVKSAPITDKPEEQTNELLSQKVEDSGPNETVAGAPVSQSQLSRNVDESNSKVTSVEAKFPSHSDIRFGWISRTEETSDVTRMDRVNATPASNVYVDSRKDFKLPDLSLQIPRLQLTAPSDTED